MFDVVALGELLIDFTPRNDLAADKALYEMNPGGAPANVLAAVSRLGGKTAFIGKVGDDYFGHFLENTLISNNINAEELKFTKKANTTLAFVHLNREGDRSFSFYRSPGADTLLEKHELNPFLIRNSKIFHIGSLSMTAEPSRSATIEALHIAKSAGVTISFDPNWRPSLWTSIEAAKTGMFEILQFADILKISGDEMELLTGEKDFCTGSRILYDRGIRLVVVTMGPKGCFYRYAKGSARIDTYDTKIVDTTGAGDAFTGALLYRLTRLDQVIDDIDKEDMEDIFDFSNAAGALCASKMGAIPSMSTLEEINYCRKTLLKVTDIKKRG